jgi:uncharacterized protein YbbC (DUF1343 family)
MKIRPVKACMCLLEAIRAQAPDKFAWTTGRNDCFRIDLLAGTDVLRKNSVREYLALCEKGEKEFAERRKPYLLY